MFNRIVVGIDEETRGRDAIELARALAVANTAYTFVHVYPAMTVPSVALSGYFDAAADSRRLLESVVAESGLDAQVRWVGGGSVGAGLHSVADDVNADLLVVGATGRGRFARTLLGNPTRSALSDSVCPVAVAPEGFADHARPIEKVGVAYDGSQPSETALEFARSLALEFDAELSAFAVVPAPGPLLTPGYTSRQARRAHDALVAARDRIIAHPDVEPHVACGEPVAQLAGYSSTVDLLVAGSRGAGAIERILHPSTTAALTDAVSCPLLVLTRHARRVVRDPVTAPPLAGRKVAPR